jgi:hypothetical protein
MEKENQFEETEKEQNKKIVLSLLANTLYIFWGLLMFIISLNEVIYAFSRGHNNVIFEITLLVVFVFIIGFSRKELDLVLSWLRQRTKKMKSERETRQQE